MRGSFAGWDDRTLELAARRFTEGLEQHELATLDSLADERDLADFELALAELHVGCLDALEAPPAHLARRLELQAAAFAEGAELAEIAVSATPVANSAAASGFGSFVTLGGWLAAAVLLAAFLWSSTSSGPRPPAARRSALVASAGDLVRAEWTATEDPLAAEASGDVVWSPSGQEGYMRFRGLAPNDPSESQYQLWIFDLTRADWEAKPVDGGVFDVGPGGEVVVPIDPKLEVRDVALFAVTLEAPGGVVVSEREHLVLTASI